MALSLSGMLSCILSLFLHPHVPRFSVSELDRGEDRSKDQHKGWESMKERQYLLEQRPSELNAHILVALHVEKVEGLLAAQRPSAPWETLTVPHSKLQLYMDSRSFLASVDPIGAKPVVRVPTFLDWAVLVHVQGCPIQHLLHLTPLQEKDQTQ